MANVGQCDDCGNSELHYKHFRSCVPRESWPAWMFQKGGRPEGYGVPAEAVSGGASAPASSALADGQALERSQPSETACDCGWSGKDIAKHRARAAVHKAVTA